MITVQTDGSLSAMIIAAEKYCRDKNPVIENAKESESLFCDTEKIIADEEKSELLLNQLRAYPKVSKRKLTGTLLYYTSNEEGGDQAVFQCLRAFFYPPASKTIACFHQYTINIEKYAKRFFGEVHRFKGFVRFRNLNSGIYYAPVEPDFPVLPFLAVHFKRRFSGHRWMIHDVRRNTAVFFDGRGLKTAFVHQDAEEILMDLPEEEINIEKLWKKYFNIIAIPERRNLKLQRQFVPERYWKYLVENLG